MAQTLPIDVVFAIIEAGAPVNPGTILPASDGVTKTLLAWTQVCRATSVFAARLLRRHCMYIDTKRKLLSLLNTMRREDVSRPDPLLHSHDPPRRRPGAASQMFLSPFSFLLSMSRPWDDAVIAAGVRELLFTVAPTLRRIIVDMPLRDFDLELEEDDIRPTLREGFDALVNLEELVSVRDELPLCAQSGSLDDEDIWSTSWPKLRRLALKNVFMNPDVGLLDTLASVPSVESVVLTQPYGLYDWHQPSTLGELRCCFDIKQAWINGLCSNADHGNLSRPPELTILFISLPEQIPIWGEHEKNWEKIDLDGCICLKFLPAHSPSSISERRNHDVENFVRGLALDGRLFDEDLGERMDQQRRCAPRPR